MHSFETDVSSPQTSAMSGWFVGPQPGLALTTRLNSGARVSGLTNSYEHIFCKMSNICSITACRALSTDFSGTTQLKGLDLPCICFGLPWAQNASIPSRCVPGGEAAPS